MVSAIVLMNVERDRIKEVAETLISFRVYSRHDLEAAFSLGPPR